MKTYLFFFVVLISANIARGHEHARHGFVLMAKDSPVLYHLARFNSPHEYQGLFGVSVLDKDGKPIDFNSIPSKHNILSIVSTSHFSLEEDLAGPKPFSFDAELYDGYLRGPDKTLVAKVTVERRSVIHFQRLSKTPSLNPKTRLIAFCDPLTNRFYAAHFVEGSPNFEELFSIEGLYQGAVGEVSVTFPCTMDHMGEIWTVVNRPGDQPIKDLDYLDVYSPALGNLVQLSLVRRLLLDENAINGK